MTPILVVLPFHNGDVEASKRLLAWISELAGPANPYSFSILLAADSAVPIDQCREIKTLAQKSFQHVDTMTVRVTAKDWRAPNEMFHHCARFIKNTYKLPFLWLEPDCTPISPNWMDQITTEYNMIPRKYMGPFIECSDPGLPKLHMSGCSVYPNDAIDILEKHCSDKSESAWDISSASDVVATGKAFNTRKMQHLYGQKDLPPTFVRQKEQGKEYPINAMDISFVKDGVAIFHRCKDGTLISVLREMRNEMLNTAANSAAEGMTPKEVSRVSAAIAVSEFQEKQKEDKKKK